MSNDQANIEEQLRAAIRERGAPQYQVASAAGCSESTISRFMNREKGLRSGTLCKIAAFLGLELVRSDELVELRRRQS